MIGVEIGFAFPASHFCTVESETPRYSANRCCVQLLASRMRKMRRLSQPLRCVFIRLTLRYLRRDGKGFMAEIYKEMARNALPNVTGRRKRGVLRASVYHR